MEKVVFRRGLAALAASWGKIPYLTTRQVSIFYYALELTTYTNNIVFLHVSMCALSKLLICSVIHDVC